jgi:pimeloyl-ACP methyl ester carboxylesterase
VNPETKYAKTADGVSIAYQSLGDGSFDLFYVPGWASNLEYNWENPRYARFLRRLGSFSRLIVVDRRGTGLSDRLSVHDLPPIEVLVEDLDAVMDAAGVERATLMGFSDGADLSALHAATHPQRTSGLVIYGTTAVGTVNADFPWGWSLEQWDEYLEGIRLGWGTQQYFDDLFKSVAPTAYPDDHMRHWFATYMRLAASPSAAVAIETICRDIDLRGVLGAIQAPTLVLQRIGDETLAGVEGARDFAMRIPGARLVELPGDDALPWAGDQDSLLDEVEDFTTGVRRGPEPERVLATVLFTDIVGSTQRAAQLGDNEWRDVLEAHHLLARTQISRHRGHEIDTQGDGFFASFDGPARAVLCAQAIQSSVEELGLHVRAGVHTGECELIDDKLGGMGVVIGARIGALAGPDEVLVSSTVKDLVAGSGLSFEDRGEQVLKGVPGTWRVFAALARM